MTDISPRGNRVLIALAISLSLAILGSLFTETAPDSAIRRGDFPAFYTLAVIAHEGAGERLYDLVFQQEIQARYWASLNAAVLPVAYPAFLAIPVTPLAYLNPEIARICWILCMLVATHAAVWILSQGVLSLARYRWQTMVVWLCFFPLFTGVIGGQAVGLSLLILAAIVTLSRSQSRKEQLLLGTLTGLWMFKPHYALTVVCGLIIQRRGWALLSWGLTSVALWLLGICVSGIDWLSKWFLFAERFSHIDLVTNSDQMAGLVPFFFSAIKRSNPSIADWSRFWSGASLISAVLVPLLLLAVHRVVSANAPTNKSLLYLSIPPILMLFAPAANFYDLALLLIPLSVALSPVKRGDVRIMIAIIIVSACTLLTREYGFFGGSFLLSSCIGVFVVARVLRLKPA
jgi:hypothetical protein